LASQTHRDLQPIIVNDGGSRADVDRLVAESGLKNTRVIHHFSPVGRGAAFNAGLEVADGTLIGCLDDDDTYHPDFCRRMESAFRGHAAHYSDAIGIVCRSEEVYEDVVQNTITEPRRFGECIRETYRHQMWQYNNAEELVSPYFYFIGRHDFLPVQTLFRRDFLIAEGGFREDAEVLEDKPLYFRMMLRGRVFVLDEILAFHHNRNHKDSSLTSNTMFNKHYNWRREFANFYSDPYHANCGTAPPTHFTQVLFPLFRESTLHLLWELRGEHLPSRHRMRVDWKDAEREILPYILSNYKWSILAGLALFATFTASVAAAFCVTLLLLV
jgi:glycosyltransferase involved in cell wall biosynthesis